MVGLPEPINCTLKVMFFYFRKKKVFAQKNKIKLEASAQMCNIYIKKLYYEKYNSVQKN